MNMSNRTHVSKLNVFTQKRIKALLRLNGYDREAIQIAMNGRLCDLEDVIDLDEIFEGSR